VEPTTSCVTKTYEEEKTFRQQVISGRLLLGHESSGNSTKSISSVSSSRVYTPRGGGSTTNFTMAGVDPTIMLP
jgi:hypothetical protein